MQGQEQRRIRITRIPHYLSKVLPREDINYIKRGFTRASDVYSAYVYGRFDSFSAARRHAMSLDLSKLIDAELIEYVDEGRLSRDESRVGAALLVYRVFATDSPVIKFIASVSSKLANNYDKIIREQVVKATNIYAKREYGFYTSIADELLERMAPIVDWYVTAFNVLQGKSGIVKKHLPILPIRASVVHAGNGVYDVKLKVEDKEFVIPFDVRKVLASVEKHGRLPRFWDEAVHEFALLAEQAGLYIATPDSITPNDLIADMDDYALAVFDNRKHVVRWDDIGKMKELLTYSITEEGEYTELTPVYDEAYAILDWFRMRAELHGHRYITVPDFVASDAAEIEEIATVEDGAERPIYIGKTRDDWYVVPVSNTSGWRTRSASNAYVYALYAAALKSTPYFYRELEKKIVDIAKSKGITIPDAYKKIARAVNTFKSLNYDIAIKGVTVVDGPKSTYFLTKNTIFYILHADVIRKVIKVGKMSPKKVPMSRIKVVICGEKYTFSQYRPDMGSCGTLVTPFGSYGADYARVVKSLGGKVELMRYGNKLAAIIDDSVAIVAD